MEKETKHRGPRLNIWLSEEQKLVIQAKAKLAGLSLTDYVIAASTDAEISHRLSPADLDNLRKIGINLNQAVRFSNTQQVWNQEIEGLIEQLKLILTGALDV